MFAIQRCKKPLLGLVLVVALCGLAGATVSATAPSTLSILLANVVESPFGLNTPWAAGPKQVACSKMGCPDETYHHCFSGTVTINTPIGDISGSVTCYEPNHGGPGPGDDERR